MPCGRRQFFFTPFMYTSFDYTEGSDPLTRIGSRGCRLFATLKLPRRLRCGRNQLPRKVPRKVPVVPTYYNMWARAGIAKLPRNFYNAIRRQPAPPSSKPLAEEIAAAVRLDNGNHIA